MPSGRKPKRSREAPAPKLGLPRCRGSVWERIVILHARVNRGERFTADSVAKDFETDERTIERTMEMMRDRFGMMIVWSRAAGRYVFDPPHEHLPIVRIEPDEDDVLKLIKRIVPAFAGPVQIDGLNRLLTKLSLIAGGSNSFARDAGHGIVSPFAAMSADESRFLQVLGAARDQRQELCVHYQSADSAAPQPRTVHPLEFGFFKQRWIVFVHDLKRNKPITLRLDRIHDAQTTGRAFTPPTDYDPAEILRGNLGAFTGNEDHEIRLRLRDHAANDARSRKWHPSQTKVECADGRLEITLHLNNLVDILHDVLFWGPQVEVLDPPELRRRVHEELKAALAIYTPSAGTGTASG